MLNKIYAVACFIVVLVGCAGEPLDYDEPVDPIGPTVRDQMKGRHSFDVAPLSPDGEGSFVTADVAGDLAGEAQSVELPVLGGFVTARTDAVDRLQVEALVVDIADVVLTEQQFPPHGLWLSGMQLRLATPVFGESAWADDDEAAAVVAQFDILFEWGVVLSDGQVHPLATQTLRDVPFQLDIGRQGPGGLRINLAAYADGVVWHWAQFVEVSNLGIDLVATE